MPRQDDGRGAAGEDASGGFDGEAEADGASDGDQRREARIAARRQGAIQAFAFDASGLGDFGDTLRLGDVAQGDEKDAGLIFILKRGLQIRGGEFRVVAEAANDGLVMRCAGFTFHGIWSFRDSR